MVLINGEPVAAEGMRLSEYLAREGIQKERVAVELNEMILPKEQYEERVLKDGDVLEIVSFVGGG